MVRTTLTDRSKTATTVEWLVTEGLVSYPDAVAKMEARAAEIAQENASEQIWLLEHPPLYTGGVSADPKDLFNPQGFPTYASSRGGQYTYHGPGQRVAYVMLNLNQRGRDIRCFVRHLEDWVIATLAEFNIKGERRAGRVGVWVDRTSPGGPSKEDKIAAIGIRVRRWVSFHGISFNVEPDLAHFSGITPCGIAEPGLGITSMVDLGLPVTMGEVDAALQRSFIRIFGPVAPKQ